MPLPRRHLIALPAALALLPAAVAPVAFAPAARAQSGDPRMAERGMGPADAKVVVTEYFSLTCSHCATFQRDTFPRVKRELIDTGRIRYTWVDFPLDQVALTAAAVARALPAERYEPFITALLLSQDRWAFARTANPTEELAKMAALAGMPRAAFDAAASDDGLKRAILAAQDAAEKKHGVQSTPSFVMNGKLTAGALSFDAFKRAVETAAGA